MTKIKCLKESITNCTQDKNDLNCYNLTYKWYIYKGSKVSSQCKNSSHCEPSLACIDGICQCPTEYSLDNKEICKPSETCYNFTYLFCTEC